MTRTLDEANRAVSTIMSMPYGVARSAAAEQEAARITAEGPDEARAYALFALVDSYTSTPEAEKAFLPFTQLLRWWDSRPELFDGSDTHSLFWSFKWMVGLLARFPSVPTAQIDATLDDMERRYALAGNGMSAVAGERFAWLRAQGDPGVEEAYRTWVTTPRDSFSDCAACMPAGQAEYLAETGRVREAADVVSAAVASGATCGDEPAGMESLLELLLLDLGDAAGAAAVHRSAMSHLDAAVSQEIASARHAEFLARTGHPDRALRLLHASPEHLTVSDSPGERLAVLTHVAVATGVLCETHAETPVDLAGVPARTVAELDAWARAEIEQARAPSTPGTAPTGTPACSTPPGSGRPDGCPSSSGCWPPPSAPPRPAPRQAPRQAGRRRTHRRRPPARCPRPSRGRTPPPPPGSTSPA